MKRFLLAGALAALTAVAPAQAGPPDVGTPSGYCDGDLDVACRQYPCERESPCMVEICVVWTGRGCL